MSILKQSLILVPAFMLLSACGGGGGCAPSDGRPLDTTTDTSANCANTTTPSSIALTYPRVSTITHLTDKAGTKTGIYSYAGSVTVTDRSGNAVADDTIVQLDVIDTIIAQGTIGAGDSVTGSILTDTNSTFSDDFTIGAADFSTANVNVSGASIGIDNQSLVLITNGADKRDQKRTVSSVTGNTVTTTSGYTGTYPNSSYVSGTSTYVVGKTTVGMDILGIDPDTGDKLVGYSKTKDGKASFRIEYPANDNTIGIGCYAADVDTRFTTLNSRNVWVTAQINADLTIVDNQACFSHILPDAFSPAAKTVPSGSDVDLRLADAENVSLPFYTVEPSLSGAATGDDCITVIGGGCTVNVTGNSGDTITYAAPGGGTSAVITIQ